MEMGKATCSSQSEQLLPVKTCDVHAMCHPVIPSSTTIDKQHSPDDMCDSAVQVYPDPWIVYMQEMIRTGKVVHVGFDDQNRPLFRVVE